jgi:hypothetical protein
MNSAQTASNRTKILYWTRHVSGSHTDKLKHFSDAYGIFSPTIVRVRMRWVGHVAQMGEGRGLYRVLVGKPEGKRPRGDPGVDWRILLRWIFITWDVGVWTGLGSLRIDSWQALVMQ